MVDILLASLPIGLPILTAIITLIIGIKYSKNGIGIIGIIGIGGAFLSTLTILVNGIENQAFCFCFPANYTSIKYTLLLPSNIIGSIGIGLLLDPLSIFMATLATGLGLLIALFSIEYMHDDEHLTRYWFFFQVFVAGMNLLVLANDLILLYIGWETVGLCSYALIGHWFQKPGEEGHKAGLAGIKAFIYTHVADMGLLLAIAIIYVYAGTLDLTMIASKINLPPTISYSLLLGLIFIAAMGKSAQFPFMAWLSSPDSVDIDAMQGPTTVSALIHAATMVKAGVYLIARMFLIFRLFPVQDFAIFMGIIVAITVIISALFALTSKDIKRVLAYSTISQLSYMFLALTIAFFAYSSNATVGDTAFLAGIFQLLTHAIFKALLFLSAAAIIHSIHVRSMLDMGGLRHKMPVVFYSMLIGACALIGIPLFSGFFSKESILGIALTFGLENSQYAFWGLLLYLFGTGTAFLTAAYTTRMIMLVFSGEPQSPEAKSVHNPSMLMQGVLIILAILAIFIGYFPELLSQWFDPLLGSSTASLHLIPTDVEGMLSMLIVLTVTALGVIISYLIYQNGGRSWKTIPTQLLWLQNFIAEGFYIDQTITWAVTQIIAVEGKVRRIRTGDLNINMVGVGTLMLLLLVGLFVI